MSSFGTFLTTLLASISKGRQYSFGSSNFLERCVLQVSISIPLGTTLSSTSLTDSRTSVIFTRIHTGCLRGFRPPNIVTSCVTWTKALSFGHQPSGFGAWCGGGLTGLLSMVSHPDELSHGAYLEEGLGDLCMGADLGLDRESKRSCNLFCEAVCGRSGVAGALFLLRGRPRAGAGACACKSS